jgi:O-antigen/teichoic acid export membrane protein
MPASIRLTGNLSDLLLRGASLSVIIRVVGLGLAFLAQVLISRIAGAEAYGDYMYCFSGLAILLVFTRSGTDEALVRFLPGLIGQDTKERRLIDWSLNRTIYPAWMLTLLLLGAAAGLYLVLEWPEAPLLATLSLFIPVLTMLWNYQARLRAHRRNLAAFLPNEIVRPLLIIGLLGTLALSGVEPSLTTLLAMSLFATTVAVGLMAGYARLHGEGGGPVQSDDQHQWTRTANHFFLIAICLMGTQTIDIVVVGSILDSTATAHYAAAQRIASLAGFGVIAVNLIIAPLLPPLLQGNHGRQEAARLLRYGARLATAFVCLAGGLMWLLNDLLLGLFGDGFEQASDVLGILLLAQLMMAVSGSLITLMMMSGRERGALVIIGGCGLLNVLLCTVLTVFAGATGTAIAVLISTSLQQVSLWLLAQKTLGIRADII